MEIAKLVPPYTGQPGPEAVARLVEMCIRHQGGGTIPIADFIISLYNAAYARPDAYLLCRRIDDGHFADVLTAMVWFRDAPGRVDVHSIFGKEGSRLMKLLMESFGRMPGPEL
jgi:hypothetical protein